jgi:hypothetical protein
MSDFSVTEFEERSHTGFCGRTLANASAEK